MEFALRGSWKGSGDMTYSRGINIAGRNGSCIEISGLNSAGGGADFDRLRVSDLLLPLFCFFDLSPALTRSACCGDNRYRNSGEGVADCGGCGIGPLGTGFCGGNESVLTTRNGRFADGLVLMRRGEPDSLEQLSDATVVPKEPVADAAERGTSVESSDVRDASRSQEP
jgi:hypothetical protein